MAHRTQLAARDAKFLWEISVGARCVSAIRPRAKMIYISGVNGSPNPWFMMPPIKSAIFDNSASSLMQRKTIHADALFSRGEKKLSKPKYTKLWASSSSRSDTQNPHVHSAARCILYTVVALDKILNPCFFLSP
jgi:hypothetical protein